MIRVMRSIPIGRLVLAAVLAASLLPAPARAQSTDGEDPFPPELEADLSAGATALYRLDFDHAEEHIAEAVRKRPDHPSAHFFRLILIWYRLTYDSLLNRDQALEREFGEQAERTARAAENYSLNRDKAIGYLYWGGALGATGWYYVMKRQWVRAYFSGKKGLAYVKKVLRLNPRIYDAHLGMGMYQYYAATLGPALKVLSYFFIRGDREEAFLHLRLAESRGRYVRAEAAYFLWNAAMDEGRLAEAEEQVKALLRAYPGSPFMAWCEIQTLFYQKRWQEVLRKAEEFAVKAGEVAPSADMRNTYSLLLAKVFYHAGAAQFNLGRIDLAKGYFEKAVDQPAEFSGWRTMGRLRLGEIHDLENRRDQALKRYRAVLDLTDIWDSRKTARQRIKTPYQKTLNGGEAVMLSPLQLWNKDLED